MAARHGTPRRGVATGLARVAAVAAGIALTLAWPRAGRAQEHEHGAPPPGAAPGMPGMPGMPPHGSMRPLGISPAREGSGTSWLPDASPMSMLETDAVHGEH